MRFHLRKLRYIWFLFSFSDEREDDLTTEVTNLKLHPTKIQVARFTNVATRKVSTPTRLAWSYTTCLNYIKWYVKYISCLLIPIFSNSLSSLSLLSVLFNESRSFSTNFSFMFFLEIEFSIANTKCFQCLHVIIET